MSVCVCEHFTYVNVFLSCLYLIDVRLGIATMDVEGSQIHVYVYVYETRGHRAVHLGQPRRASLFLGTEGALMECDGPGDVCSATAGRLDSG